MVSLWVLFKDPASLDAGQDIWMKLTWMKMSSPTLHPTWCPIYCVNSPPTYFFCKVRLKILPQLLNSHSFLDFKACAIIPTWKNRQWHDIHIISIIFLRSKWSEARTNEKKNVWLNRCKILNNIIYLSYERLTRRNRYLCINGNNYEKKDTEFKAT